MRFRLEQLYISLLLKGTQQDFVTILLRWQNNQLKEQAHSFETPVDKKSF